MWQGRGHGPLSTSPAALDVVSDDNSANYVPGTPCLFSDSLGDQPLPLLVDAWRTIDEPQAGFLGQVISQKLSRRAGVRADRALRVDETRRFLVDCCSFLQESGGRNGC
jgi:hypothetical protein